jgi:hypothetical protein
LPEPVRDTAPAVARFGNNRLVTRADKLDAGQAAEYLGLKPKAFRELVRAEGIPMRTRGSEDGGLIGRR